MSAINPNTHFGLQPTQLGLCGCSMMPSSPTGGLPSSPGLNMGPSMDSLSGGSNAFAGGLSGSSPLGGQSGQAGGAGGLSQLLPQLLQIMSMIIQMMSSLLGGAQQQPGQGQPGGGQIPSTSGGGSPDTTGGAAPTDPSGGRPDGSMPPTAGGGAPTTGGGSPTTGDGTTVPPSTGGDMGSGKVDWAKAPENLKKLQPYIQKAAAATGAPEALIAGSIWQESGGNVNVSATDGGSDQGLMQIDNNTYSKEIAGQHGLPQSGTTPTDPANNIMAGATYMAMMKKKFGTWDLALRGYNSGENGVDIHNANARPAGTGDPNYVIYVNQHIKALENGTSLAPRG